MFNSEAYKRHLDAARQAAAGRGAAGRARLPEGQAILRAAVNREVVAVLRAGFAGHAPGLDDEQRTRIRPSQHWRFATVEKIRRKLDA